MPWSATSTLAALAGHLPAALADARTLLTNEPEALMLTGLDDPESAARALAGHGPTAVVTLAAGGALCAGEHGLVRAPAPEVTASTPTAPAICSPPPGCGPTWPGYPPRSGCSWP